MDLSLWFSFIFLSLSWHTPSRWIVWFPPLIDLLIIVCFFLSSFSYFYIISDMLSFTRALGIGLMCLLKSETNYESFMLFLEFSSFPFKLVQ